MGLNAEVLARLRRDSVRALMSRGLPEEVAIAAVAAWSLSGPLDGTADGWVPRAWTAGLTAVATDLAAEVARVRAATVAAPGGCAPPDPA